MNLVRLIGHATGRAACVLALPATLAACAYEGPAAQGNTVRAIMASQVLPPQPRRPGAGGTDAAVTGAALNNYRQSYVVPVQQNGSAMVGASRN